MNYIYDILTNFNDVPYDFFEWNSCDNVIHIRKIPVYKISSEDLIKITKSRVKINKNFVDSIHYKTETFLKNKIGHLDYACLLTDSKDVYGILLNRDGKIKSYTKLLLDEEDEVLEYSNNLNVTNIEYEIISKIKKENFKTRNEMSIKNYIYQEINRLIKNNDFEKLQYMYLDCFNKKDNPIEITETIFNALEKEWSNVYLKIYDFLKFTTTKR